MRPAAGPAFGFLGLPGGFGLTSKRLCALAQLFGRDLFPALMVLLGCPIGLGQHLFERRPSRSPPLFLGPSLDDRLIRESSPLLGQFAVVVEKGRAEVLVSFCATGAARTDPKLSEVLRRNYRSNDDIDI